MLILRSIYNFSNHCKYTCLISLCQKQFFTINQQLNRMKTGTVWNIMRARNVYPYPTTEKISHEKKDKIWHAVYLENEYLKVMILPELGGRIQRAYDKTNDYDFVYYNHVIKPALVGLAGPWISWCPCQGEDERRQLLIRLEKTLGTRKA
mgnify:CR=1 FL=1